MTDHHRQSDDALISLAERVGELAGTQKEIKESLDRQWERQQQEDADHAKIKQHLSELNIRMEDVPQDKHHSHHDWIAEQIEAARARSDLCRRARNVMIERALPYAILAMIAAGLYMVGAKHTGLTLLEWIKQ